MTQCLIQHIERHAGRRTLPAIATWSRAALFCERLMGSGNEGVEISPRTILTLGLRDIQLSIDIYEPEASDSDGAMPQALTDPPMLAMERTLGLLCPMRTFKQWPQSDLSTHGALNAAALCCLTTQTPLSSRHRPSRSVGCPAVCTPDPASWRTLEGPSRVCCIC